MKVGRVTLSILAWQYSQAFRDIFAIWKNFLMLVYRVFSFPDLIKTLFSPWRRLSEPLKKGGGFSFEQAFGGILVNVLMRVVGLFVRTVFIIIGLVFLLFVFLFGLLVLGLWALMPLMVVGSIGLGFSLLFI